jgi:hypothetical protein
MKSLIAPVRNAINAISCFRNVIMSAISIRIPPHLPAAFIQIGIVKLLEN